MKVKICGIRTAEEAKKVYNLYPDAIGILVGFKKDIAPNVVSKDTAKKIVETISKLSHPLETFLLTTEEDAETNCKYSSYIGDSHIQLLSEITTEEISKLKRKRHV